MRLFSYREIPGAELVGGTNNVGASNWEGTREEENAYRSWVDTATLAGSNISEPVQLALSPESESCVVVDSVEYGLELEQEAVSATLLSEPKHWTMITCVDENEFELLISSGRDLLAHDARDLSRRSGCVLTADQIVAVVEMRSRPDLNFLLSCVTDAYVENKTITNPVKLYWLMYAISNQFRVAVARFNGWDASSFLSHTGVMHVVRYVPSRYPASFSGKWDRGMRELASGERVGAAVPPVDVASVVGAMVLDPGQSEDVYSVGAASVLRGAMMMMDYFVGNKCRIVADRFNVERMLSSHVEAVAKDASMSVEPAFPWLRLLIDAYHMMRETCNEVITQPVFPGLSLQLVAAVDASVLYGENSYLCCFHRTKRRWMDETYGVYITVEKMRALDLYPFVNLRYEFSEPGVCALSRDMSAPMVRVYDFLATLPADCRLY